MPSIFDQIDNAAPAPKKPAMGSAFIKARKPARPALVQPPAADASDAQAESASVKQKPKSLWSALGGPEWAQYVRTRDDEAGTAQTHDGGTVRHHEGGLHLARVTPEAIAIAAIEARARGMTSVVVEATDNATAQAISQALAKQGITDIQVEITPYPGQPRAAQADPAPAEQARPSDWRRDVGVYKLSDVHAALERERLAKAGLDASPGARNISEFEIASSEGFEAVSGEQTCWCCKEKTPVFAIEAHDLALGENGEKVNGPLKFIRQINPEAIDALRERGANMDMRTTKGSGGVEYLSNVCTKCEAVQGDHYLHMPDGAFGKNSTSPIAAHDLKGVPLKVNAIEVMDYPVGETLTDLARPQAPIRRAGPAL